MVEIASESILQVKEKPIGVAVITSDGIFPNDNDYRRADNFDKIEHVLKQAKEHLKLTDTTDWVVFGPDNNELDPEKTFADFHLGCVVELDWHKREGGGGCC